MLVILRAFKLPKQFLIFTLKHMSDAKILQVELNKILRNSIVTCGFRSGALTLELDVFSTRHTLWLHIGFEKVIDIESNVDPEHKCIRNTIQNFNCKDSLLYCTKQG